MPERFGLFWERIEQFLPELLLLLPVNRVGYLAQFVLGDLGNRCILSQEYIFLYLGAEEDEVS